MFTGMIEEVGSVGSLRTNDRGAKLELSAPRLGMEIQTGDSVAVNGCCLTATSNHDGNLTFDLLQETLARTNLGALHPATPVNLERALSAQGRLGGHFVQGHIDCTVRVLGFEERGADRRLEVELQDAFAHYAASKGSIALNGVSLTIAELLPASLVVWIIPLTRQQTNLESLQAGDILNVEFDIIAKYVERMFVQKEKR
jgi:riboflavin synthase